MGEENKKVKFFTIFLKQKKNLDEVKGKSEFLTKTP